MFDISINGVTYDYIDKCKLNDKDYIVFENEEGVYVSEFIVSKDNEVTFKPVDIQIQRQVMDKLGLDYDEEV